MLPWWLLGHAQKVFGEMSVRLWKLCYSILVAVGSLMTLLAPFRASVVVQGFLA
jgi:hypothetical protein